MQGEAKYGEVEDYAQQSAQVEWVFQGTAEGDGVVSGTIVGQLVSISPTAGQSSATVAANFATAVNNNSNLTSQGITAIAVGNSVFIGGGVTHSQITTLITDSGLVHDIPALSLPGQFLLAGLLLTLIWQWRRRLKGVGA